MVRDDKKKLTEDEIKKSETYKMLVSLISNNVEESDNHLHLRIQDIMRDVILGEKCKDHDDDKDDDDKKSDDKDDDDDKDDKKSDDKDKDDDDKDDDKDDDDDDKKKVTEGHGKGKAFAMSGKVMDDKVKGKIKYENGGKKTLKKHGNAPKELDDDKVEKTKFKSGGKQPMRTLEPTKKPEKFNDGRDKDLGTTKS